jgi:ankyrin repeat protein
MLVAASQGDEATVRTLLSMAQSMPNPQGFINCQNAEGCSALHTAAGSGRAGVTRELLAARCIVDLQAKVCLEALLEYFKGLY